MIVITDTDNNLTFQNDMLLIQNDFNINVLTVGPSGPGGPSINIPCEDENKKMVMVRVMVNYILYCFTNVLIHLLNI